MFDLFDIVQDLRIQLSVEFVCFLPFIRAENLTKEILGPCTTLTQTLPKFIGQHLTFDELLPEHSWGRRETACSSDSNRQTDAHLERSLGTNRDRRVPSMSANDRLNSRESSRRCVLVRVWRVVQRSLVVTSAEGTYWSGRVDGCASVWEDSPRRLTVRDRPSWRTCWEIVHWSFRSRRWKASLKDWRQSTTTTMRWAWGNVRLCRDVVRSSALSLPFNWIRDNNGLNQLLFLSKASISSDSSFEEDVSETRKGKVNIVSRTPKMFHVMLFHVLLCKRRYHDRRRRRSKRRNRRTGQQTFSDASRYDCTNMRKRNKTSQRKDFSVLGCICNY